MTGFRNIISLLAAISFALPSFAAEVEVSDPESARKAVLGAKPGDAIVLAAGEWKDADLRLDGEGTAEDPVTIRAERPGETVFTGASRIRLGGSHLVVSGLLLRNLSGANADWLEFRIDSKRRASFCRVTDCALVQDGEFTAMEKENRWVGIYGKGNQIDRCTIQGKRNKGATLVVWLGEQDPGRHRIAANLFAGRPRLGQNGGETIRVGDSKTSMTKAECLVEGNYFHRCDGETECVSNKSCGNTYRGNWFVETQGTLTLRHGNDCLVEGNSFLGRGREQTGGIRVIGEGHRVVGNLLEGLEGDGFRSAICLVNGIPGSPAHGYLQVKDAVVRGNSIADCEESILVGYNDVDEATLAPSGTTFADNEVRAREGRPAVRVALRPEGTVWRGNAIAGDLVGIEDASGMREEGPGAIVRPKSPDPGSFGASWMKPALSNP